MQAAKQQMEISKMEMETQAAKRDCEGPPTPNFNIWLYRR